MSTADDLRIVELVVSTNEQLQNEYSDVCDIDFLIKELESKKKRIIRRMDRSCCLMESVLKTHLLKSLIADEMFKEYEDSVKCTRGFISSLNSMKN